MAYLRESKSTEFIFSKKATKIDEIFIVDLTFTSAVMPEAKNLGVLLVKGG